MTKYLFLFFFLVFFSSKVKTQEKSFDIVFESKLKNEIKQFDNPLLNKASAFFLDKQIDSTLFYCAKHLNTTNKKSKINNYFYFFRGLSFKEKALFDQAKKNLLMVDKDFSFYISVINHLGHIALEQNKFLEAEKYFKKIENIENLNFYNIDKGILVMNLGMCFFLQNKFELAENYLLQSAEIQKLTKDTLSIIASNVNLANIYYEQYKDELAVTYFKKAYDLSKKTKYVKEKYTTTLNMAVVEENNKNYKKAIEYRKEADIWKDSLNDQNKVWNIAQLEKKFAISEKEKKIELLEVKNEVRRTQRNGLLIIASFLILILGISFYFYNLKVKRNKIIQAQKEDLDELNATKDKLFSIVSHDLRSSVNALKSSNIKLLDCLENKNYLELDVLLHKNSAIANGSYNLLDNLLNWANQQTNQLYFEKESLHLKSIVSQVEYNFKPLASEKNIDLIIDVDQSHYVFMDLDSFKIILRNILDNALKFTNEKGIITISSKLVDNQFIALSIADNGVGMDKIKIEKLLDPQNKLSQKNDKDKIGSGLGFQLCKSMIVKNEGKLEIESEIGIGTKIILYLPKNIENG